MYQVVLDETLVTLEIYLHSCFDEVKSNVTLVENQDFLVLVLVG